MLRMLTLEVINAFSKIIEMVMMVMMMLFSSEIGWRVDAEKFDFSGEPEPAYSCISPIR